MLNADEVVSEQLNDISMTCISYTHLDPELPHKPAKFQDCCVPGMATRSFSSGLWRGMRHSESSNWHVQRFVETRFFCPPSSGPRGPRIYWKHADKIMRQKLLQ